MTFSCENRDATVCQAILVNVYEWVGGNSSSIKERMFTLKWSKYIRYSVFPYISNTRPYKYITTRY